MGYIPPIPPPRLNLDRFGMPLDYATYVWMVYHRHVEDASPARRAFLNSPSSGWEHPSFGQTVIYG
jgi:hypothetical protein